MANTKIFADGNALSIWFGLPNFAADPRNPTVTELNACVNVTESVSWDSFSFGTQASNQNSDPSWIDVGNAQTRGFAQFAGSISFFYPGNYTDVTDANVITFQALRAPRTLGYVIIRIDGQKTTAGAPDARKPGVSGDFLRIYKVLSDGWADVNTGELNFKYTITFQPQGDLWVNAYLGTPIGVATPAPIGAVDYTVGGKTPLSSYITGRQLASTAGQWSGYPGWFNWTSSDPSVASVDKNGVVTGLATGDTEIVATWPHTGAVSTSLEVTIAA